MNDTANVIRILIVEDEQRLRDGLLRAIPAMGFVPVGAASGEEALKLMQHEPCNVVLLDLNLPGMSGMELFQVIRENWPATQVVIVTGYGDLDSAKQAVHLDAVEFLTKPCTLAQLEEAIGRACQRQYEHDRLNPVVVSAALDSPDDEFAQSPSTAGKRVGQVPDSLKTDDKSDTSSSDCDDSVDDKSPKSLQELEREHILEALARNNGNRTAAAEELGISRRTLHYRIREYQRLGLMDDD